MKHNRKDWSVGRPDSEVLYPGFASVPKLGCGLMPHWIPWIRLNSHVNFDTANSIYNRWFWDGHSMRRGGKKNPTHGSFLDLNLVWRNFGWVKQKYHCWVKVCTRRVLCNSSSTARNRDGLSLCMRSKKGLLFDLSLLIEDVTCRVMQVCRTYIHILYRILYDIICTYIILRHCEMAEFECCWIYKSRKIFKNLWIQHVGHEFISAEVLVV